jgi:inorganic pyrophosphatase
MIDGGKQDDKIIALPFSDPTHNGVKSIHELPSHIFDEIRHFFTVYKQLENKQTAVKELFDRGEAEEIVSRAIADYKKLMNGELN